MIIKSVNDTEELQCEIDRFVEWCDEDVLELNEK